MDGSAKTILSDRGWARTRANVAALACLAQDAIRATKILRHDCQAALQTMTMPRATEARKRTTQPRGRPTAYTEWPLSCDN
jgi:hypothetical protein